VNDLAFEVFLNPKHVGEAATPNFKGRSASFQCGAILQVTVNVDDSQHISDAKFKAAGCSVLVAATSLLLDRAIGKTTAEAANICRNTNEQRAEFQDLPLGRNDCVQLAHEALLAAIQNYSDTARDDWEGDEALICTCFCVSERTIEREVRANNLQSIKDVTAACNAGGGCRSCYPLIQEILDNDNREL
jgi:NifU-like protein